MTYSFGVMGKDKADAVAKANRTLDQVVAAQADHAVDTPIVRLAIEQAVEALGDDDGLGCAIGVSGGIGWAEREGGKFYHQIQFNVTVQRVKTN